MQLTKKGDAKDKIQFIIKRRNPLLTIIGMETITGFEKYEGFTINDAIMIMRKTASISITKEELFNSIITQSEKLVELADLPWKQFKVDMDKFESFAKEIKSYLDKTETFGPCFYYNDQEVLYKIVSNIEFSSETSIRCNLTFFAFEGKSTKLFEPQNRQWVEVKTSIPYMQNLSEKQKSYIAKGSPDAEFVCFCSMHMTNLNDDLLEYYMKKYVHLRKLQQRTKDFMEFIILNNNKDVDICDVMIGLVPKNPEIFGLAIGVKDDTFVIMQYLEEDYEGGAYHLRKVDETKDIDLVMSYLKSMVDHYTEGDQFVIPLSLRTYTKDFDINDAGSTVHNNTELTEDEKRNQLAVMEFVAMLMAK